MTQLTREQKARALNRPNGGTFRKAARALGLLPTLVEVSLREEGETDRSYPGYTDPVTQVSVYCAGLRFDINALNRAEKQDEYVLVAARAVAAIHLTAVGALAAMASLRTHPEVRWDIPVSEIASSRAHSDAISEALEAAADAGRHALAEARRTAPATSLRGSE